MKKIEIADLCKSYRIGKREVLALDHIALTIEQGDVFGIIGMSGAGKSTLLRCMASLEKATSGRISFDGLNLNSMSSNELMEFRLQIGMIFQHFNLLSSRTVAGNVAYPLEIAGVAKAKQEERIDEILQIVGLTAKKNAYPATLSGGEKQRVGIARALANHPQVLFCDEATSALDPKTTKEILLLLKEINQKLKVTVVLITHEMEVIKQVCNKVAVIESGRIIEEGWVTEVFSQPQHKITKEFLQKSSYAIPQEFLKGLSPNRKLLRLQFKGEVCNEPIISEIIRNYQVDANILLGWIDRLQNLPIGSLVIELLGSQENISKALQYLNEKDISYEEVIHGL